VIDLGDFVVLTFNVRDASGALADAGAAVLTVTLPDASTSTPAVTHTATGVYTATFTTTQAGRHAVRWVATGANAQAYTDVFNVSPAAPGLIISLADARLGLGLTTGATAKDDDLRSAILGATPIMEDLVGPILSRSCDEWHDGGAPTVRLLQAPCLSVATVVESWGTFTRTLTAQPLDGTGFDAYGYTVDLNDGILQRRVSGQSGIFNPGRRNIHVTYVAGRTVISENILKATRRLVRHFWQQEQQTPPRPDLSAPESTPMTTTPSGFAVPQVVVDLCAGDLRTVGIG
jgi:hypothetical protein